MNPTFQSWEESGRIAAPLSVQPFRPEKQLRAQEHYMPCPPSPSRAGEGRKSVRLLLLHTHSHLFNCHPRHPRTTATVGRMSAQLPRT